MRYSKFFYISFAVLTALALVYFFFIDGPKAGSGAGVFASVTGVLAVVSFIIDTKQAKSLNDQASNK